ncbi:reverse transcriptase domain-containing protein [Tanacetum coccineum]
MTRECPLNKEVNSVEKVKYGEFRRPFPNNNGNGDKYHVGPPRYYTHVDNRSPFGEKKPSLEELMNKHLEESTRRRAEMEEWMKKLSENTDLNTRNQNASLNNLETQIEQLAKDYQVKVANEVPNLSVGHCKAIFANDNVPKETKEGPQEVLQCQLPQKKKNPGSFTLPCTFGSLKFYAIADLGASVNILSRSMFNHLKLKNLKETNLSVEMADMAKKAHVGIVENVLVKIDKFLFHSDFMIIDMLGDPNETMIIGRPLLVTIHDRIGVFDKEILLGVGEDIIVFDMNGNVYHPIFLIKKVCIVNEVQEEKSFNPLEIGDGLFLCLKKWNSKIDDMVRARRYIEWCAENNKQQVYGSTPIPYHGGFTDLIHQEDPMLSMKSYFPNTSQENQIKPLPRNYSFKEWLKLKIGHTNANKTVKNAVLNEWVLDCFEDESKTSKDLFSRSFEEYKLVFDIEIEQLANEYELGIGKKGTSEWVNVKGNDPEGDGHSKKCPKGDVATAKKSIIEITSGYEVAQDFQGRVVMFDTKLRLLQ